MTNRLQAGCAGLQVSSWPGTIIPRWLTPSSSRVRVSKASAFRFVSQTVCSLYPTLNLRRPSFFSRRCTDQEQFCSISHLLHHFPCSAVAWRHTSFKLCYPQLLLLCPQTDTVIYGHVNRSYLLTCCIVLARAIDQDYAPGQPVDGSERRIWRGYDGAPVGWQNSGKPCPCSHAVLRGPLLWLDRCFQTLLLQQLCAAVQHTCRTIPVLATSKHFYSVSHKTGPQRHFQANQRFMIHRIDIKIITCSSAKCLKQRCFPWQPVQRLVHSKWMDGFLSLEEITQFSVSHIQSQVISLQGTLKVKVKERTVLREIHLRTTGRHLSMGSHSVICHPTEVTAPPSPQPGRLVLDLSTL